MGVKEETSTTITCDNPGCPGVPKHLTGDDLHGWVLITSERYGEPTERHVFCTFRCASAAAGAAAAELDAQTVAP